MHIADLNVFVGNYIEYIRWPCGATKFLFEYWLIFPIREEKFCISKRPCNVLFTIYYVNINEIPNHFTLIVFSCERRNLSCSDSNGDLFTCEDNMLFSHVRISCFCTKAHLAFHWCLYSKISYSLPWKNAMLLPVNTHWVHLWWKVSIFKKFPCSTNWHFTLCQNLIYVGPALIW